MQDPEELSNTQSNLERFRPSPVRVDPPTHATRDEIVSLPPSDSHMQPEISSDDRAASSRQRVPRSSGKKKSLSDQKLDSTHQINDENAPPQRKRRTGKASAAQGVSVDLAPKAKRKTARGASKQSSLQRQANSPQYSLPRASTKIPVDADDILVESLDQTASAGVNSYPVTKVTKGFVQGSHPREFTAVDDVALKTGVYGINAPESTTLQNLDSHDFENQMNSFEVFLNHTAGFTSTTFLFLQGIFAGFGLLNAIQIWNHGSDEKFLEYYSPISASISRAYFFLSLVSSLGACDRYRKEKLTHWGSKGQDAKQGIFIIFVYLLSFLFTCIASEMDDNLSYMHEKIPYWWKEVPIDSDFEDKLDILHGLNYVRIICPLLAWILVSMDAPAYPFNANNMLLYHLSKGTNLKDIEMKFLRSTS